MKRAYWLLMVLCALALGGCVNLGGKPDIKDSGPTQAVDLSHVQDAVPRVEPRTGAGNKTPYKVLGKTYHVKLDVKNYSERGVASWYGNKFHGRNTSNGEVYDMYAMTAAHKTLPIPCYVRVTNLENDKQVVVRVNDRGPFHDDRLIDLSYAAAAKLGFAGKGTAKVEVTLINPGAPQKQIVPEKPPVLTASLNPSAPVAAPSSKQQTSVSTQNDKPSAPKAGGTTYLQAGAFSNENSAVSLRDKLSALVNYPVFIEKMDAVTRLFRVRIGPVLDDLDVMSIQQIMSDHQLGIPHLVRE